MAETNLFEIQRADPNEFPETKNAPRWGEVLDVCLTLPPGGVRKLVFRRGAEEMARRAAPSLSALLRRHGVRREFRIRGANKRAPRTVWIKRLAKPTLPKLARQ